MLRDRGAGAAEALAHGFCGDAAHYRRFGRFHALKCDQQHGFAMRGGQRGDGLVSLLPLANALAYMFKPTEERLALMRPLSLAGIFAGLNGVSLGLINTLRGLWLEPPRDMRIIWIGTAESIVPIYVAFSCLMLAWLLVAAGMRRKVSL